MTILELLDSLGEGITLLSDGIDLLCRVHPEVVVDADAEGRIVIRITDGREPTPEEVMAIAAHKSALVRMLPRLPPSEAPRKIETGPDANVRHLPVPGHERRQRRWLTVGDQSNGYATPRRR